MILIRPPHVRGEATPEPHALARCAAVLVGVVHGVGQHPPPLRQPRDEHEVAVREVQRGEHAQGHGHLATTLLVVVVALVGVGSYMMSGRVLQRHFEEARVGCVEATAADGSRGGLARALAKCNTDQ
eukprot:1186194-Prorocentrum_minimum.AAC.2